jgi:hypothetical protein
MVEERAEMEDNMQRMMAKTGAVFEGTGEETASSVQNSNAMLEEDHPVYDPYGQLGYGFQAYFSSLQIFSWLFLLLTVLMLPAFFYFDRAAGLI